MQRNVTAPSVVTKLNIHLLKFADGGRPYLGFANFARSLQSLQFRVYTLFIMFSDE